MKPSREIMSCTKKKGNRNSTESVRTLNTIIENFLNKCSWRSLTPDWGLSATAGGIPPGIFHNNTYAISLEIKVKKERGSEK